MRATWESVPHVDWILLGDDAVKAVKGFKAEASAVKATKVQSSTVVKNIDQKPGVSKVITDPPSPGVISRNF